MTVDPPQAGRPDHGTRRLRAILGSILVDRTPFRLSADYRRIWWAELISTVGSQITMVAVFIQVYAISRSAAAIGIVGLVQFVPLTLAMVLGGPIIDRFDRRTILLWSQLGLVMASGLLLLGSLLDSTPLWMIYVPVGLAAALSSVAVATRMAIIANLVPVELLSSAVALSQVMWNMATIAGPAIAGVTVASLGLSWAYGIDVVSFAGTIYVTARLSSQLPKLEGNRPAVGVAAIREAFAFIRGKAVLQASFGIDLVAMIFGMPRALFPILAAEQFDRGVEVVGALFTAIAVGAVFGASTAGWVGRIRRQGVAVLVAVVVWGASIAIFGVVQSLPIALALLALAGAADVISSVFRGTILQTSLSDAVRGRITSIHTLVVAGGPRLGDLEAGFMASIFTPTVSVVSGGVMCILGAVVVAAAMPHFARYRSMT